MKRLGLPGKFSKFYPQGLIFGVYYIINSFSYLFSLNFFIFLKFLKIHIHAKHGGVCSVLSSIAASALLSQRRGTNLPAVQFTQEGYVVSMLRSNCGTDGIG